MGMKLNNIIKEYGENHTRALNRVSIKIEDGEMVAIMGTSGSGKSTLLNILGCIDKADSGDYILDGVDINSFSDNEFAKIRNETLGFIFQHFALLNDYTVYENIEMPLLKRKNTRKVRNELIENALREFNILEHKNKRPSELSGGQQQRVAIIRALITEPKYILADEPTGALDRKTSDTIMDILRKVNNDGKTIIIVTHDINVANVCDRIINIEDGVILD